MSSKLKESDSFDLSSLPPLPKSWRWCIPADCCSVIASGSTPKPDLMHSDSGEVPFIKVYNLTHRGFLDFSIKPTFIDRVTHAGSLARSRSYPNDVLINIVGPPLGKVSIVPDDHKEWNINQAIVLFRPLDWLLSKYLAFALLNDSIMRRVTSLAKATAGQSNISVSMCRRLLPLPIAPIEEQHRIVAKIEELFSELDAGVAALERARANLKRYRASLLKSAVEGKLTEEWRSSHPDVEPASKLLERILKERRQKWEADQRAKFAASGKTPPKGWQSKYVEPTPPDTTNLPTLPNGWCWAALSQIAFFQNGHAYPSKDYCNSGVRLLRPGNLFDDGTVRWTERNTKHMPLQAAIATPNHIIKGGELVINLTAQSLKDEFLGRICLTDKDEHCLLNQRIARISPVGSISAKYLLYVLKSRRFRTFVDTLNTGSLIQHMFTTQLDEFVFPLAPNKEQIQIILALAEKLSHSDFAESAIEQSLKRSARLRQSILKRAFEGKLVPQDSNNKPTVDC